MKGRNQKPMLRGEDDFNWGKVLRVVLTWSAIIMAVFVVMTLFKGQEATEYDVTYTQYQEFLCANKIARAVVKKSNFNDFDFHGTLTEPEDIMLTTGKKVRVEKFTLTLPYTNIDDAVIRNWTSHHVNFNITKEDNVWINALIGALPWILLLGVWLIIFRRMQGEGRKESSRSGRAGRKC